MAETTEDSRAEAARDSMKVRIDGDEWYPVYSVREDASGLEVEATPEQRARWAEAATLFREAQEEMAALYEPALAAEIERQAREKAERDAAARAERDRLAQERRAAAEAEAARREAMWERIRESGGVVYDAEGRRIGEVRSSGSGMRLDP